MSELQSSEARPVHKHAHPIVFLFLNLPFGVTQGYVTVTLAFLFSKAGISLESISWLVAASILPGVVKFLWAPLIDAFLTLKMWYFLSAIITAVGMFAMGVLPIKESSLFYLTVIVYAVNIAVSFLGISVNGMIAHDIPEEIQGRASGYFNAGNLGGVGIGGGAGLWLAEQLNNNWMPSAILAIACALCCLGLFFVNEHPSTIRDKKVIKTLENLLKDVWITIKARMGLLAMLLCFVPLGTGAAQGLWAAIAKDWNASAHTVEFVTGIISGLITTAGCLIGGWICDRSDKRIAYIVFGIIQAVCLVVMAYLPHSEVMYIAWTSLYAFALGLSYAAFSSFVYEAIGKGAAGTKYTVYASLSNLPIWYMTLFDGWAQTKFGSRGMLNTEALCAIIGVVLFLALMRFLRTPKEKTPIVSN